jgi:hypothetical protein
MRWNACWRRQVTEAARWSNPVTRLFPISLLIGDCPNVGAGDVIADAQTSASVTNM